jgi:hypothetical protein
MTTKAMCQLDFFFNGYLEQNIMPTAVPMKPLPICVATVAYKSFWHTPISRKTNPKTNADSTTKRLIYEKWK